MKNTAKRNAKATFAQLIDALMTLAKSEKASALLCEWLSAAVGSYEDAFIYLPQVIARTDNPVIAMLATQALKAR